MIILIRCDKEVKSYNNWTTTFNSEMSDINDVFISNGLSTILLYRRKLPDEVKKSTTKKRGINCISSLDHSLLTQDCILFYHGDVIDEKKDVESIEDLFKFCHENGKHLVTQFSLENQHMINHICTGSEVYIDRGEFKTFLTRLDRELKLSNFLD
jgi:hypothetical protein